MTGCKRSDWHPKVLPRVSVNLVCSIHNQLWMHHICVRPHVVQILCGIASVFAYVAISLIIKNITTPFVNVISVQVMILEYSAQCKRQMLNPNRFPYIRHPLYLSKLLAYSRKIK
jgi:hypothetical protein